MKQLKTILEMIKFSHSVFARSVAMTFNRIADARIDARNPRTADRPLPTGRLSTKAAWAFLITCACLFLAATFLFYKPLGPYFGYGNYWPPLFALPTLLFICLYSYTKRFTWASHFWLGASLMLAPLGAWIAISPPTRAFTAPIPWLLATAVLLWTAGFDIIYACQDITVDRREKLYSLPANLGLPTALWISRTCHSLAITLLLLLAHLAHLGPLYLAALAITALLILAQHLLVRRGRMTHINLAFATLNGAISLLLAAATITDILL